MDWEYTLLWEKSKVNAFMAHKQDNLTPYFPLWCSISLETLSRATLAFIHPSLLADPSKGSNILYVFDYYKEKEPPKSIPIKTVFDRLTRIVEQFKSKEIDFCLNLMERRNSELHSGAAAFADFPNKFWLADYYRICNILITFQKKEIKDWLPDDDAKMAIEMIKKDYKLNEKKIKKLILEHKNEFYRKPASHQKILRIKADSSNILNQLLSYQFEVVCPSCKSKSIIRGEIEKASEPYLDGDEIVRKISILPTYFHCVACELKLSGYDELQIAGFGGYFDKDDRYDPKDYYNFDSIDYYEPDYGND